MEKDKIYDLIKTTIYVLVGIFIVLFLIKSCEDDAIKRLEGKQEILEKNYNQVKKELLEEKELRKKQTDSLSKEISKREVENQILAFDNRELEKEKQRLKNQIINVPKDLQGQVNYYNERYNTTENKVVEDKVGLGIDTAMDVSYELEEGDRNAEIVQIQEKQITNQEAQISNLEKDKEDLKTQLTSAEEEIAEEEKLRKIGEENAEVLKKQVQKLNNKDMLNKILIPASFVIGGFIGYEIAK